MSDPINIAIADDHALFRKGLCELLAEFSDIKILFDAANGKELISRIKTAKVKPDVCLLDLNMPLMNGFETALAIKKAWPKMKILALSMYDQEFTIIKMLRSGANGYVLKDVEPHELRKAIMEIYKSDFYLSEPVTGRIYKLAHETISEEDEGHVNISEKEMNFLKYCCSELTYKQIAEEMQVSFRTIDGYRDSLFVKLRITSRTGLAVYAIRKGYVELY